MKSKSQSRLARVEGCKYSPKEEVRDQRLEASREIRIGIAIQPSRIQLSLAEDIVLRIAGLHSIEQRIPSRTF